MDLRINVLGRPHAEALVVSLEDLCRSVLDVLEPSIAAPLAEGAAFAALDEEETIEAVVAAAFAASHLVLFAERAVAVHLVRVFVEAPEKI